MPVPMSEFLLRQGQNLFEVCTVVSFKEGFEKILYILDIHDNDMNYFSVGEKK